MFDFFDGSFLSLGRRVFISISKHLFESCLKCPIVASTANSFGSSHLDTVDFSVGDSTMRRFFALPTFPEKPKEPPFFAGAFLEDDEDFLAGAFFVVVLVFDGTVFFAVGIYERHYEFLGDCWTRMKIIPFFHMSVCERDSA